MQRSSLELKSVVVEENHGIRKEAVGHAMEAFGLHNGEEEE